MRIQQKSKSNREIISKMKTPKGFLNLVIPCIVFGLFPAIILHLELLLQQQTSVHLHHITATQKIIPREWIKVNNSDLNKLKQEESEINFISVLTTITLFVYITAGYAYYRLKWHPAKLRQSIINRMKLMVETLPASAVYLYGETTFMNRAAEEMTGYNRTDRLNWLAGFQPSASCGL